jgi:hypothetical protein
MMRIQKQMNDGMTTLALPGISRIAKGLEHLQVSGIIGDLPEGLRRGPKDSADQVVGIHWGCACQGSCPGSKSA